MNYLNEIKESANYILNKIKVKPDVGIILGSGFGTLADKIEDPIKISYSDIPNFPVSTVKGHEGKLVIGVLEGKNVLAMQGRFHYYEGYDIKDVTFPIRVMKEVGIDQLIVTNAAGGSNKDFEPGDLMIITDHINFAGINPLMGKNYDELGPRFLDLTNPYDEELINITKKVGENLNIDLKEGTYMWFSGPTYETPAEVKMAQILGADAVGMSTVPEVIVANHGGMKVLGISCITNMAAGILDKSLSHEDVIKTSEKVKDKFELLVKEIIKNM